jgi:uncharacterized membrane protein YeaQ/YmgE (transglycosylase-associated protein family)
MDWLSIIIQIIAGAIGGNAAGKAMKDYDLGTTGNSIAGVVGGVIGGQILERLLAGRHPLSPTRRRRQQAAAWISERSSRASPAVASAARS